jgi:hypothetical protein
MPDFEKVNEAASRVESGEMTGRDFKRLMDYMAWQAGQEVRGRRVGGIVRHSGERMAVYAGEALAVSLVTSPAGGVGKLAARGAGFVINLRKQRKLAVGTARLLEGLAARGVAGKIAANTLRGAGTAAKGAAVYTAGTGAHELLTGGGWSRERAYQDVMAKRLGLTTGKGSEAEGVYWAFNETAPDFVDAMWPYLRDTFIEGASEGMGGGLMKVAGLDRVFALQQAFMARWIAGGKGRTAAQFIKKLTGKGVKASGWHGFTGEMLEEQAGRTIRAGIAALESGEEGIYGEWHEELIPTASGFVDELLAIGLMSGAVSTAGAIMTPETDLERSEKWKAAVRARGDQVVQDEVLRHREFKDPKTSLNWRRSTGVLRAT